MRTPFFEKKGDDAKCIDDAAGKNEPEKQSVVPNHSGQENQCAPTKNDIQSDMKRMQTARAEYSYKSDSGNDDNPLENH